MSQPNSKYFHYRNNELFCEDVPVVKIASAVSTPVYIYSRNYLRDRYAEFAAAFQSIDHAIFYSVKSNYNLSVIKTFLSLGCGVDVNSEGELYRALRAGAHPSKIILTGVGKTEDELRIGMVHNVLMIKAESLEEIELLNKIAGQLKLKPKVALRINPDVNPATHPYISTGLAENKFGVSSEEAFEIFSKSKNFRNIIFTGLHMHIGSQILAAEPFVEAVEKLSEIYFKLKTAGIKLDHFDIGGGMGVSYRENENFSLPDFTKKLLPLLKKISSKIIFEPGRYLTANGGILLTKVLYNKAEAGKNFIIVDAAMNDLLRPSIYDAYHHIQHAIIDKQREIVRADVVGPVCESGDFMGKDRQLPGCAQGDLLAVMSAGAYGMTMASNYNARRRPAEVMVEGDRYFIIRSREHYQHLLLDEEERLLS